MYYCFHQLHVYQKQLYDVIVDTPNDRNLPDLAYHNIIFEKSDRKKLSRIKRKITTTHIIDRAAKKAFENMTIIIIVIVHNNNF